jgi:hypothetical protein
MSFVFKELSVDCLTNLWIWHLKMSLTIHVWLYDYNVIMKTRHSTQLEKFVYGGTVIYCIIQLQLFIIPHMRMISCIKNQNLFFVFFWHIFLCVLFTHLYIFTITSQQVLDIFLFVNLKYQYYGVFFCFLWYAEYTYMEQIKVHLALSIINYGSHSKRSIWYWL